MNYQRVPTHAVAPADSPQGRVETGSLGTASTASHSVTAPRRSPRVLTENADFVVDVATTAEAPRILDAQPQTNCGVRPKLGFAGGPNTDC